jgi:hypothetical protein
MWDRSRTIVVNSSRQHLSFFRVAISITLAAYGLALGQSSDNRRGAGARSQPSVLIAAVHWENVPLDDAVARLTATFHRSVFVDRRLDPGHRIRLKAENAVLEDIVLKIAAGNGWGMNEIGSAIYLGPAATANHLPSLAAMRRREILALGAVDRRALEEEHGLGWHRLATPRELVVAAARERGWGVRGQEAIPHDLWRAGRLPELALADQLTLLLIGFDLTFRIMPAERTLEIIAVEEEIGTNGTITAIAEPSRTARNRSRSGRAKPETKQLYTLRVEEKPVGEVLRQLDERLDWQLEVDQDAIRQAGLSLDRRVSFSVANVEEDQLLESLLAPARLGFRRDGERIMVFPRAAVVPTSR